MSLSRKSFLYDYIKEVAEEEEEVEVNCICDKCFGEGTTLVSSKRAKELKETESMEVCCPFGDRCNADEEEEEEHEHMEVECIRCDKIIKVPMEHPKNKYGYGCFKCFDDEESDSEESDIELSQSRKDFWDKVIKRLTHHAYESDGRGGKRRVPNYKMYDMYESCFGDLIEGMTPKQVASKINKEANK